MDDIRLYENDYEKPELTEEFLEHHGIKGQQWGVRNGPPYPLKEGARDDGRYHGGSGHISKHKARKLKRKRVKALKKARAQRSKNLEERKQVEKTKEEIIKNRDTEAMLKNIDQFSTKEIIDFNNRENEITKLAALNRLNIEARKSKTEKAKDFVKKHASGAVRDAVATLTSGLVKMGVKKILREVDTRLDVALEKGKYTPNNNPAASRDEKALAKKKR